MAQNTAILNLSWLHKVALPLLCAGLFLHISAARAESYQLGIMQTGTASDIHWQSCDDTNPACTINLTITDNHSLDIAIQALVTFQPGGMQLRFEEDGQPFAMSHEGSETFYIPLGNARTQTNTIALYTPNPLMNSDAVDALRRNPVQRLSHDKIAELEITIRRNDSDKQKPGIATPL